jgi:DNA-binding protein HU-beta
MNNADLAERIAEEAGVPKSTAKSIVDSMFEQIRDAAAKGEEVSINGFGKFKVKDTPARSGRNPSTGEVIQIKASKKVTFTPAKALKDVVAR